MNLNQLSFTLVGLVMAASLQAQEDFTIQGMKAGMTEAELLERAEELKDHRDIQREQRIFKTPQGEELEETIHTSQVSWVNLDTGNTYRVELTRKPMEPRAHFIERTASYEGTRDVTKRPTFEAYKAAVLEKYGDPIEIKERTAGVTYIFSESTLPSGCPSVRRYQYKTISKIKDCPAILKVSIASLNQPNHPLKFATFTLRDPYLGAKDRVEFRPYWNQWMNDYLASKKHSEEKPEL